MRYFVESSATLAILCCVLGLVISWKNFFRSRNSSKEYEQALTRATWLSFCGSFIQRKDSLLMRDTGEDLNGADEPILYVDYVRGMSLIEGR